jgi:hypothetical protein
MATSLFSQSPGNETKAATHLKQILEKEGLPCQLFALEPDRANLVARLKGGRAKRPLLVMGHTDVVGDQGQSPRAQGRSPCLVRVKNKTVIDTFAKRGNEAVKEFGRLDAHVKAFAYNKGSHELMRMKIQSWYDGSAADKDFHAESANYIVHVGARSFAGSRGHSCHRRTP